MHCRQAKAAQESCQCSQKSFQAFQSTLLLPVKSSSMLMKPSEVELVVSTENPGSPSSGSYAYPIPKELY